MEPCEAMSSDQNPMRACFLAYERREAIDMRPQKIT